MIIKRVRSGDVVVLATAAFLIILGVFLPSKEVLKSLTGISSENYQGLNAGIMLFRIGIVMDGLILIGMWRLQIQAIVNKPVDSMIFWRVQEDVDNTMGIRSWLVLGGLFAIASALRVKGLDSGLWYDEVVTLVEFVRLPLGQLLTNYDAGQNNHPLFSLLAHLSLQVFGESAWALRLPAFLFGLASLWALYCLARTINSRRETLLAVALMAVSYHHVWFSQNARGYTGLLFWMLLGTWLFLKGLQKTSPVVWFSYAVAMALGMYTHLTAGFILAGHMMIFSFLFLRFLRKKYTFQYSSPMDWWPVISFFLVGLFTFQIYALVLPQVVNSFQVRIVAPRVEVWTNPIWAIVQVLHGLQVGFSTVLGGFVALLIFGVGLVSYARSNRIVVALFVLPVVSGVITLLLLHRHFYPRFFFPMIGIGILVLMRGTTVTARFFVASLSRDSSRKNLAEMLGTVLACIIIIVTLFSLSNNYHHPKQDFWGALTYIKEHQKDSDLVITVGLASYPYERYYGTQWKTIETLEELNEIRFRNSPIWLLYTFPDHLESFYPEIMDSIRQEFIVVKEFPGTVGGGTIYVCRNRPLS